MSLVRHTSVTVAGRWIGIAAAAAAGLVVAVAAGARGAGTFSMVRVLPATIAGILCAGVPTANAYLLGGGRRSREVIAETTVALALLFGGVGWLGWLVAGDALRGRFYPQLTTEAVAVVGSTILLGMLRDFLNSLLQGLQRFTGATLVLCLDDLCALLVVLPLLRGVGDASTLIVLGAVGGVAVSVLAAVVLLARAGVRPWPRLHPALAVETVRLGLRSHVGNLANMLTWRLDVIILSMLASVEVVGCYAVASKVAELFRPLGASLTFVLRPVLAGVSASEARARGVFLYRRFFAINLASVAIVALIGGPLIVRAFGPEFAPAVPAFQILLIGIAAHGADPVLSSYYVGIGRPEYATYTALVGLLVTVVGDLSLIPSYSLIGAAIASALAYTTKAVAFTALFVATSRISWLQLIGMKEYGPDTA